MKQINNYISEKLFISKEYHKYDLSYFEKYLNKYGCRLEKFNNLKDKYFIVLDDGRDIPRIEITDLKECWKDSAIDFDLKEKFIDVFLTDFHVNSINTDSFETLKDKGYLYCESNVKKIAEILKKYEKNK